jgi:hypothetical protein
MITDDELEALLHEAGGEFAVPARGPAAVIAAAAPPVQEATIARRRFRPGELVLAGTSVAAAVALVVVLMTSSGGSVAPVYGPSASTSTSNNALGPARTGGILFAKHATPAAATGREIIATGTLRFEVSRLALRRDIARIDALAGEFGGYVSAADLAETGANPGGTIVVKVPAGSFSAFISRAEGIAKVKSLAISDTDVTAQVVDLGASLTALVDERSQLEVLLGRAGKVSDLLSVENTIEDVQSQIEQIQGEQRTIAMQVSYSALTVDLVVPRPPHVGVANGFGHAWHEAVSDFANGVKALIVDLGDILFGLLSFIVIVLIILGLWRSVWPMVRRRIA